MENIKGKINKGKKTIKNRKVLSAKNIKAYINKDMKPLNDKINSLTTKNKKILRPSTTFLSKNINNYRYLFDSSNKETIYNTKWVLNLRTFVESKTKKPKIIGEPRFYQEDLEKYISKKKKKIQKSSSVYDFETFPDLNKYKHFFKINNDNHGTYINKPLINFNISLRENNIKVLNKWNSNINIKRNKYFFSCVNLPKESLSGKISDKNIMRPYKIEFKKDEYNGDKIVKRIYSRDKVKAYNIFGTHNSSTPYNDNYIEKNYGKINELLNLCDKTQSKTWYQIKLRNILDNNGTENKFKEKNLKKWKL